MGFGDQRRRDDRRGKWNRGNRGYDDRQFGSHGYRGHGGRGNPRNGPIVRSVAVVDPNEPVIDRNKVCPLLLRVFDKPRVHHDIAEFNRRGHEPKSEIQIYTWMDATLGELFGLLQDVVPGAQRRDAIMSFAFVYPDRTGRNIMRQVGSVHSTRPGDDDYKRLKDLDFQTGDFLSVCVR